MNDSQAVSPDTQADEPEQGKLDIDSGDGDSTISLSPSAIDEMFQQLDEENMLSTSAMTTTRYFVEKESSGDFIQVRVRQSNKQLINARRAETRKKNWIDATKSVLLMCWVALQKSGEKALVVMLLGVMTGMCWADAINLRSGNVFVSAETFDSSVCAYSAGSNRWRQECFILLNGVLFGLIRDLMRMYPHDQYKCVEDGATAELSLSRLLHAAVALLSLAFVALLSGSPSAFRLSRLLHENTKWLNRCEEKASDMSRFFHDITILRSCALLLVIFITIAWLLFALQCSLTMTLRNTNSSHVAELQEELADLKTRLCKLQGSYLERLSAEELRSLIQLHQRAIEQTENALVLQLQASI